MKGLRFQLPANPAPWQRVLEEARIRSGLADELYFHGATDLLERGTRVAFAGTREAEAWTLAAIEGLAGLVAGEGGVVVSGGAVGTDTAAHRGALQSGGGTVVVLPVPIDSIDPTRWRRHQIHGWDPARTLFLSPFPPGTRTRTSHPILRNRLIAALGRAAVVGQTRPRSGTNHFLSCAISHRLPRFLLSAPGGDPLVAAALLQFEREGAVLFDEGRALSRDFARGILRAAERYRGEDDSSEQLRLCEPPQSYGGDGAE